jgi:hypothetical protein
MAAVLLGLMGGSFTIGVGWTIFANAQPPVVVLNSTIISPKVPVGGDLRFRIKSMTNIDLTCLGSVTREFYIPVVVKDAEDAEPKLLLDKKREWGPPPIVNEGETDYIVSIPLPPNTGPGEWLFQGETTYECGYIWAVIKDFPRGLLNGGVKRFKTKVMPFKVVAVTGVDQK